MRRTSHPQILRAVHQFHASVEKGDGVTNGISFTQRLLRELGLKSEIFAVDIPKDLQHKIRSYREYSTSICADDELLLVHYSMGHNAHDWISSVARRKILVYHNITPPHHLSSEHLRHYARLGRKQLALWGAQLSLRHELPLFEAAITDSDFNASDLYGSGFDTTGIKIETIPLLVDLQKHRKELGASHTPPLPKSAALEARILFVGRLARHKCQDELIRTFNLIRRGLSRPARLTLIGGGDPEYRANLHQLVDKLRLNDMVDILGKVSDRILAENYRNADLFLSLSEHEGFCMPLIEATIHQIPIIAFGGCDAIAETLGGGGIILPCKDHEVVAAMAVRLLEEPALRRTVLSGQTANLKRFEPGPLRSQLQKFLRTLHCELPNVQPVPEIKNRTIDYRIEGPFTSSYSLALVNRELGLALSRAGKNVELRSVEGEAGQFAPDERFLAANPGVAALSAHSSAPGIEAAPADVCLRNMFPPRPDDIRAARIRGLACYAWEETGFPRTYTEAINRSLDLVTVTSSHVKQVLQDNGVYTKIAVVGDGTDHLKRATAPPSQALVAASLKFDIQGFRFLHISSCLPRKGVDILLKAWAQLSKDPTWQASLVIKTLPNPHNRAPQMIEECRKTDPQMAPIILLQEEMSADEIAQLYAQCDALVAPSRAEGYGLPLAEAMLAGKPVITTGWGGQTDFCTEKTSWLVDWSYDWAETHLSVHASVWAEPNLEDLVRQMHLVRTATKSELQTRIDAAQDLLQRTHSWDHVAARVNDAVASISSNELDIDNFLPKVALVSTWSSRCGIATYAAAQVAVIPTSHLKIFANTDAVPLVPDAENVERVWRADLQDDLNPLLSALKAYNADVIVFQFNFGFFKLDALSRCIDELRDAGKAVHLVLHSTSDVNKPDLKISLRDASAALSRVTRLIVHSLDDLNRLKKFGLHRNAMLLSHGVPVLPSKTLEDSLPGEVGFRTRKAFGLHKSPLIATFGFLLPGKGIQELILAHRLLLTKAQRLWNRTPHLLMLNALYPNPSSERERDACVAAIQEQGLDKHVTMITDYLPESEALSLLQMSDLIVYTYQASQDSVSGAVRLGLASGRPVAVTPISIFEDVASVTHKLPGFSPNDICLGVETILRSIGAWGKSPFGTKVMTEDAKLLCDKQEKWIEECAWPTVATRFWNMLRATR